jgi:hypothetical protein
VSGDIERFARSRDRSADSIRGDARRERPQQSRDGAQVLARLCKVNLGRESVAGRDFHGVSLAGVHQVATLADRPATHSATAAGDPLVRSVGTIRKRMSRKSSVVHDIAAPGKQRLLPFVQSLLRRLRKSATQLSQMSRPDSFASSMVR